MDTGGRVRMPTEYRYREGAVLHASPKWEEVHELCERARKGGCGGEARL